MFWNIFTLLNLEQPTIILELVFEGWLRLFTETDFSSFSKQPVDRSDLD